METVAPRTYKVTRSEFPLSITITPKNTTGNAATTVIVGHIRETKNGEEIDERDADIDDAEGIITYDIAVPQSTGTVTMVQTLLGFFAKNETDNARFEITIETATGDKAPPTAIRRPTFNPGTATLKFQV
jgi:hypothetical protein